MGKKKRKTSFYKWFFNSPPCLERCCPVWSCWWGRSGRRRWTSSGLVWPWPRGWQRWRWRPASAAAPAASSGRGNCWPWDPRHRLYSICCEFGCESELYPYAATLWIQEAKGSRLKTKIQFSETLTDWQFLYFLIVYKHKVGRVYLWKGFS